MPNADSSVFGSYKSPKVAKNLSANNNGNKLEIDISSINPIQFSYSPSLDGESTNFMFGNDQSTNSSDPGERKVLFKSGTDLSLDEDGKIKPYIDFSSVFIAIEEAKKDGLIIEDD